MISSMIGREHSEEPRKKISEATKGKSVSEETRKKISSSTSEAMKRPEVLDNIRKARKSFSITKTCVICGKEYIAHSNSSKYCSDECKWRK